MNSKIKYQEVIPETESIFQSVLPNNQTKGRCQFGAGVWTMIYKKQPKERVKCH